MSEHIKKTTKDAELVRTPNGTIEFRTHDTDITMDIRGHSAEDIFRLAGWGLAHTQVAKWPGECTVEDDVDLVSDDWDDGIVNWLNQLVFLCEKHRAFWTDFEFEELDAGILRASVKGRPLPEEPEALGRDVKSASYIGIEVIPGPPLWLARVTLDL
jgi:SHS2 domain-containing protein